LTHKFPAFANAKYSALGVEVNSEAYSCTTLRNNIDSKLLVIY